MKRSMKSINLKYTKWNKDMESRRENRRKIGRKPRDC